MTSTHALHPVNPLVSSSECASACCAAKEEDDEELYGSPSRADSFEQQSADGNSMAVVVKEESEDQLAGLVI